MQREIKFRAWDKNSKVMVDLLGFKYVGKTHIQLFYQDEDDCSTTCTVLKENIELFQSTGLKDKNGKEIYEGDILSFYDIHGMVKLGLHSDDVYNGWYVETTGGLQCELNKSFSDAEDIGNIHKNPELLEAEDNR